MSDFTPAFRLFAVSIVICSMSYPLIVLGFAAVVAPEARQGSLLRRHDGSVVGSRLLAQNFSRPGYFWPRPSACNYDATAAGGSNLSPTSPALTERATKIIQRLQPSRGQLVPADLLSASGSGLDPHITLAAALFQVPRVAAARNLSVEEVEQLVHRHTNAPSLAILGDEAIVNVLELNLALDANTAP